MTSGLLSSKRHMRGNDTLCKITLVQQARNDMRVLKMKVIMGPKHICRDDCCKTVSILKIVRSKLIKRGFTWIECQ